MIQPETGLVLLLVSAFFVVMLGAILMLWTQYVFEIIDDYRRNG